MKLFISDLDGTLFKPEDGCEAVCSKRNKEAIFKWIEEGNIFAVATGRNENYYPLLKEDIGINVDAITSNGSTIFYHSGEIETKRIPIQYYFDICKYYLENDVDATPFIEYKGKLCTSWINRYPINTSETFEFEYDVLDLDELDKDVEVSKITIIINVEQLEEVKSFLKDKYDGELSIVSSNYRNIDIGPKGCNKGAAIIKLMDKYKLDIDDVFVIGDSENDIEMLAMTQHSYAMSHAPKAVLNAAHTSVETVADALYSELNKSK